MRVKMFERHKKECGVWAAMFNLLLLALVLVGCGENAENKALEEGQYYVYYVNSSGTALNSRIYEPESTDTEGIIAEFLEQCQTVPAGSDGRRAIPSNVVLTGPAELEDGVAKLHFDTTYTTMDKVTELLCKAALAKTITQLEGVDYISIYVNGNVYKGASTFTEGTGSGNRVDGLEEETRASNGAGQPGDGGSGLQGVITTTNTEKTLWSASDFLDNTGDDTNKYVQADLLLYFANPEGNALLTEERTVVYSNTLSLERVILNQLIEGPKGEGYTATLPVSLKIQGVSIRDGVCYVDFDNSFLEQPVNVTDVVEIYSIVNSLTELDNVTQVQITINGSADAVLRNNIQLSGKFEKDLSLIAKPQEEAAPTSLN